MKSDLIIEKIRNKLQDSDPNKRTVENIFQFDFTDDSGKSIKTMVFDFKALKLYEGICENADAKITISDEDFFLLGTHETTFDDLIKENKVQTHGDNEVINKMMEKFRMNHKK